MDPIQPRPAHAAPVRLYGYVCYRMESLSRQCPTRLPEGKRDLASLEHIQGVLPFEVYAQAPLRLISWCSFELPMTAKRLLRKLAIMCEDPNTLTEGLVAMIAKQQDEVHTEQDATRYLANLQGRPQLRLQKSYQFQVQKTNPKN